VGSPRCAYDRYAVRRGRRRRPRQLGSASTGSHTGSARRRLLPRAHYASAPPRGAGPAETPWRVAATPNGRNRGPAGVPYPPRRPDHPRWCWLSHRSWQGRIFSSLYRAVAWFRPPAMSSKPRYQLWAFVTTVVLGLPYFRFGGDRPHAADMAQAIQLTGCSVSDRRPFDYLASFRACDSNLSPSADQGTTADNDDRPADGTPNLVTLRLPRGRPSGEDLLDGCR
jgi:hypothetical protein